MRPAVNQTASVAAKGLLRCIALAATARKAIRTLHVAITVEIRIKKKFRNTCCLCPDYVHAMRPGHAPSFMIAAYIQIAGIRFHPVLEHQCGYDGCRQF